MTKDIWRSKGRSLARLDEPYGIIGILNITPDSFFDGGEYLNLPAAMAHAGNMLRDGCKIIDLGAESTRPGAKAISIREELQRLLPVMREIKQVFKDVLVSIDTRNAMTARQMLEMGADIINDVSACGHDPELLDVLAQFQPAYILTHCQGTPEDMQICPHYDNVLDEIKSFFEIKLALLERHGLPLENIALDPGIGFGKTLEHNITILKNIRAFTIFNRPLVSAISMKSMFGALFGHGTAQREVDTAVASALLWEKGVYWHRVHHVARIRCALELACELH